LCDLMVDIPSLQSFECSSATNMTRVTSVPLQRCTSLHHELEHGIEDLAAFSGSRSASNSIEPLRSAKSTVTCLRSPSRAALEGRIFSARCLGVYESGSRSAVQRRGLPQSGGRILSRTSESGTAGPPTGHMSALAERRTPRRSPPRGDSRAGSGNTACRASRNWPMTVGTVG
jgi:hypothetical protein